MGDWRLAIGDSIGFCGWGLGIGDWSSILAHRVWKEAADPAPLRPMACRSSRAWLRPFALYTPSGVPWGQGAKGGRALGGSPRQGHE